MNTTNVCECCAEEQVGPDFDLYCNECGYSMDLHEDTDLDAFEDALQDYDNEFNDLRAVNGSTEF